MRQIPVIAAAPILSQMPRDRLLDAVRDALVELARGGIAAPPPGCLLSAEPRGDCHVKFALSPRHGLIVVKAATGFYHNPAAGLPVNDGLTTLFSATTGQAIAVIDDGGELTAARTAATAILALQLAAPSRACVIGIIGAGEQARRTALWAADLISDQPVRVWGRSPEKRQALVDRLVGVGTRAVACASIEALAREADLIVCCTNSPEPLLAARHLRPGHHVVSLGADGPGKAELADDVYAAAATVAVDDLAQARHRDDLASALRRGIIDAGAVLGLGELLADGPQLRRRRGDISLVNLCGTAAADVGAVHALLAWPGTPGRPADHPTARGS